MTKEDYISKFSNARKRYKELINSIDYDSLLFEKSKYQEKTGDPNFWDDNSLAKQILKNISSYEKEIEEYDLIKQSYEDMSINCDLLDLGEDLNDEMITTGKNFFYFWINMKLEKCLVMKMIN